ncbi:hypothetical protein [Bdellovibrio sp. ZAP7]|uniref:hypothetical protein n=1 Tax=Bdellovibrio sp. ZAP7 TaxID=2231053 RepID=UPI00115A157C|nr:hypothetical protein [Bdellovibrio sp. ZAP7]
MKSLNTTTIILVALIFSNLSLAHGSAGSFKSSSITDQIYQTEEVEDRDAAAIDVARSLNRIGAEKACKAVVNQEEEGRYYKSVEFAFSQNKFPNLTRGTTDLIAVCPKYPTLSQKEKEEVWTTILGAMAFYESTCRQLGSRRGGPNGNLGGPFQLHVDHEDSPSYNGYLCRKGDATTKDSNRFIPCVLSMLDGYMSSHAKRMAKKGVAPQDISKNLRLFPERAQAATYWEVMQSDAKTKYSLKIPTSEGKVKILKGNGSDFIKLAIKDYKYCN